MITKKIQLDQKVANQLGLSRKKVRDITKAFLHEAMLELILGNNIRLDGFGDLRIFIQKGKTGPLTPDMSVFMIEKRFIHFKKSPTFRNLERTHIGEDHGKARR